MTREEQRIFDAANQFAHMNAANLAHKSFCTVISESFRNGENYALGEVKRKISNKIRLLKEGMERTNDIGVRTSYDYAVGLCQDILNMLSAEG